MQLKQARDPQVGMPRAVRAFSELKRKMGVYVYTADATDFWWLMSTHRSHLDIAVVPVLHTNTTAPGTEIIKQKQTESHPLALFSTQSLFGSV